jgi:hypothetical protein
VHWVKAKSNSALLTPSTDLFLCWTYGFVEATDYFRKYHHFNGNAGINLKNTQHHQCLGQNLNHASSECKAGTLTS